LGKLEEVLERVNKTYGSGTICRASEAKTLPVERVESGVFALDYEIGGGFPKSRVTQIHGPFSSGKSLIGLKLTKSVQSQKRNSVVFWLDLEGVFDKEWAEVNGVDLKRLLISQPEYGQKGLDIAEEVVRSRECGLLVVDSVAAVIPKEEQEVSIEEWQMGLQARVINKFIRKITSALQPTDLRDYKTANECIVLLLNQERATMDKFHPIVTPGGWGKEFAASIVIGLRRGDWIEEDKRKVGHEICFRVEKNKTYTARRDGLFDFYIDETKGFKKGEIDNVKSIVLVGIDRGFIKRSGSYYSFIGKRFQGREELVDHFKRSTDTVEVLKSSLYALQKKERLSGETVLAVERKRVSFR